MTAPLPTLALALALAAGCASPQKPPASAPEPAPSSPAQEIVDRETLDAQITLTRSVARALLVGVAMVRMSSDKCPTVDDIVRLGVVPPAVKSRDIWGSPYRVVCAPHRLSVTSAGPDLLFDTPDDIVVDDQ